MAKRGASKIFVRRALICVLNFALAAKFRSRGKGSHASCPWI